MLASIDIGTNTVRLLLANLVEGRIHPHRYERQITRLGGGMTFDRGLSVEGMERTLSALSMFSEICRNQAVNKVRAVGTAAFRTAKNGPGFARQIKSATGFDVEIITGTDEARLTMQGVLAALDPIPHASLIVDIGGGSTEFVLVVDGDVLWSASCALGVVTLTEGCADHHERLSLICREIDNHVVPQVSEILDNINIDPADMTVVGTAGTVTTLAALDMQMVDYDWRRVNNYRLNVARISSLQDHLAPMSVAEREQLPGMEVGRGDLIMAGIEIILHILEQFKQRELVVSDFGILEGLLLNMNGQD